MERNINCDECELSKTAHTVCMWGRGNVNSDVMFIGDVSSLEDDRGGAAFIGPAGQKLMDALALQGITEDDFYITNLVKCARPANVKTLKVSIQHTCFQYLKDEIVSVAPRLIVLLGAAPCKKLLGVSSLKDVRDVIQDVELQDTKGIGEVYHKCKVFAMYHPGAVLRTPELESIFNDEVSTVANLIAEMSGKTHNIQVIDESHHTIIDNLDTLTRFADHMENVPEYALDLETTGLNCFEDTILHVACSWKAHYAAVITLRGQGLRQLFKGSINEAMVQVERLARGNIIGMNYGFDQRFLRFTGMEDLPLPVFDVMLAHHLLWEYLPHNLTDIALQLKLAPRYDSLVGAYPGAKESYANIPDSLLIPYAANDADVTFRAKAALLAHPEWPIVQDLYYHVVLPCQAVVSDMQYVGTPVDEEFLITLRNEYTKELREKETTLKTLSHVPDTFNWRSTKQLPHELYKVRGLPILTRTACCTEEWPEGNPSTRAWELSQLLRRFGEDPVHGEFLNTLARVKKLGKLCSTFVGYSDIEEGAPQKGLSRFIRKGRIHTDYHLTGTVTGRYSSSKPNLQQIPRKFRVREVFTVEPGRVFVQADYSQAELRVLAWLSDDPGMKAAFLDGADIHTQVAASIYNKPPETVTKEERVTAKFVNFGIAYQRGPQSIADQIGCSKEEGQHYIDGFYNTYPMTRLFVDEMKRRVDDPGFVQNQYGRRRRFLPTDHRDIHAEYQRQSVNFMCQSNVADTLSGAKPAIHLTFKKLGMSSYIMMTLHDAIMLSVVKEELEQVKQILQFCMVTNATLPGLDLQLPIDIEVSNRWGEVEEDEFIPDEDIDEEE